MFDFFFKNPEINSFLKSFESAEWPQLTELLLTYSIRKIPMKTRELTIKSISNLISATPTYFPMKETLSLMKQEIKHLSTAVKRIEKSSTSRSSSSKHSKVFSQVDDQVPSTPSSKVIKEPRICSLKAAERLKNLNEAIFNTKPGQVSKTPSTTKHSPMKSCFFNVEKSSKNLRISGSSVETSPNTCASPGLFVKRN